MASSAVEPKILTLLMVVQDGKVLLGYKKRGFGEGLWNGFGGKVEPGETPTEGARELREEACIDATDATERGVVTFVYDDKPRPMQVHIFHASQFTGVPTETDKFVLRGLTSKRCPLTRCGRTTSYGIRCSWLVRSFRGRSGSPTPRRSSGTSSGRLSR